jgi:hypothetical protein
MHSRIKDMINTGVIVGWEQHNCSKLACIQNEGIPKYISHFGWKAYANSKVECIQKSRK